MYIFKLKYALFGLIILAISLPVYAYDKLEKRKNVLLVCSYSESFAALTDELNGMTAVFDDNDIRLTVEYMNTKEFPTKENIASFKQRILFILNHHDKPYDLIMTANDDALDFVVDHQALFGDKPVVFFGINDKNKAIDLSKKNKFSGLIEALSIENTLRIAQRLQPNATNVIALSDSSTGGSLIRSEFYELADKFPNLTFGDYNFSEKPFNQIMKDINLKDKHTIFLFLVVTKDDQGHNYQLKEIGTAITAESKHPIYSLFDFTLNYGFVGGEVLSFNNQGKEAAEIAVEILKGADPVTIGVKDKPTNRIVFDYKAMKKYGLETKMLPYGTSLINKEISFFEAYFSYIVSTIVIIVLLVGLILLLLRAIAVNKKTQQQLLEKHNEVNELVYVDSLTGHNNRLAIMNIIKERISSGDACYMIIFVDIDNFKYINDTFGHDIGDSVICEVSNRLQKLNRYATQFGRCGGDEFLVIKKITRSEDAELVICDIMKLFQSMFQVDSESIYVTVSLGASIYPQHGNVQKELIKNADIALYEAKSNGRNNGVLYKARMVENLKDKVLFQTQIKNAFMNQEFYLAYQPIYNIHHSKFSAVEALIRWESDTLGYVSPQKLIEESERMGIINDIGSWIIKNAFEFCNRINAEVKMGIFVTINISSIQLKSDNFITDLKKIIEATNVDTSKIYFEITESVLLEFNEDNMDIINQIKALGIKIAIDDFGTGYSSLDYFKKLSANALKIDKIFIDQMEQNQIDFQIVEFIVNIAHKKGLTVTAEGAETLSQVNLLKNINCDAIQGFYFSKTLTENEVIDFFKSRS